MSHMEIIRLPSREAIGRAAMELLSVNPAASLSDVAARAGVGRATLHRHFPGRAELIRTLALEALDATDTACADLENAPSARAALERMFEALVPLGAQYAFLYRCRTDDPEIERRYEAQVESLRGLVEWLRREGVVGASVPTAWATALIDQLIWMTWTLVASGKVAARDASALALHSLLQGLGEDLQ